MRVLQVVASVNAETGGPAASVPRLAGHLARGGGEVGLASLDYRHLGSRARPPGVREMVAPAGFTGRYFRGFSPRFGRMLKLGASGYDLVHNHGLWMFPNVYARRAAQAVGIPLVISPRGMLDGWARRRSRLKKAIAWLAFERRNLRACRLVHATSGAEAEAVRAAGVAAPVAVIPNGVEVPLQGEIPPRSAVDPLLPSPGLPYVLFLSRLHPKKGIENLLAVWARLRGRFPGWHLLVAGGDIGGHRRGFEARAREVGLGDGITFCGPLEGEAKAAAFAHAGVFVLPSYSENFGIVVAEALAHGTPVITTRGTPWGELESAGCGWWIEVGEDPLAEALAAALEMPEVRRRAMGEAGRELVRDRYSWAEVAAQMASVYDWLLGGGTAPPCVIQPDAAPPR